jgi:hypothetical protein
MHWTPFYYRGQTFDLFHLRPCSVTYRQPANDRAPEKVFEVDVEYSLHCFTHGVSNDDFGSSDLLYSDNRETRVFDFERYELSKLLPEAIGNLPWSRCFHAGRGNYFSIEIVHANGHVREYDIFFAATRSSRRGRINLFVQSAYIRDAKHASNRPARKPISFWVILFNTLHRRPIRIP